MEKTKLINLLLSLNFEVVGHGASINHIKEHMNFSNRTLRINLTEDNNHISIIRSARTYLSGGYDGCERAYPVDVTDNIKEALEPFLLPKESIVIDITNWKYQPYEDRMKKEIEKHNKWCRKNGLLDCIII